MAETVSDVRVIDSQMPTEHQHSAMEITSEVFKDASLDLKRIACEIKRQYDKKYPGSGKATEGVYHCIVGDHFASAVSHEYRQHIWMKRGQFNIVLWKSKDCPFNFADA